MTSCTIACPKIDCTSGRAIRVQSVCKLSYFRSIFTASISIGPFNYQFTDSPIHLYIFATPNLGEIPIASPILRTSALRLRAIAQSLTLLEIATVIVTFKVVDNRLSIYSYELCRPYKTLK